jgi:hypothetical protein
MKTFIEEYHRLLNYYLITEGILDGIPKQQLGMLTNIKDLPNERPYGFWVDRHGNFVIARNGHEPAADKIYHRANAVLGIPDKVNPNSYKLLYDHGFIRVALSEDVIFFDCVPGVTPSASQRNFLRTIKILYNMEEIEQDRNNY